MRSERGEMIMFKCLECGNLFEEGEQAEWVEMHGFNYGNGEKWSGCPICKGDYEEIKPCKICGSYDHDYDEEYCNACKKDVQKRFSAFIEKEFTKEERELLNELYDGEPL